MMTYGYQGLLLIAGFWLMPFYLGHIGQRDYGLWLVATQMLTYLTLTDFGVVALLPLETAYATGRAGGFHSADDLPGIIGRTARIVIYQLPIVALLAVTMWALIPAKWQDLRGPLLVALAAFVIGCATLLRSWKSDGHLRQELILNVGSSAIGARRRGRIARSSIFP